MTKFSEMKYERPDMDAVKKEIAEVVSAFKEAGSYDEARDLFIKKDELEKHIDTLP